MAGKLTGHKVHYPIHHIRVRDARGYESIIPTQLPRTVFEPLDKQQSLLEEN